eukprot:jgi/Tetstr1/461096/TSEL_006239.t1
MGSKTKKKMNTSTMWLAKGMAKMMISNKDTEILANNLKKLPPQRTPPELDRLQHSAKGLPIFKALRKATKKSRELCRVLKVKEIGRHESWQLRSQHMLVVVLSGEVVASAVDKEPLENVLSGEQDNLEAAIGMDIPTDEVLALHTAASESMDDPGGVADESALPEDAAPSSEVAGMSLDDWQRVFEQTDEDCSGSLSSEEIFIMLKACKIDVEFHDVEHLVAELDDDGSLELEFEEFAVLITKLTQTSGSSSWKMKPGFGWQNVFKTGSFFGEASLLNGGSINATLEAAGGLGAKFMILDQRSFQAVMREGFDAYMAQRVEFLKGHCQLFHGLNRLSDIKSIAFIADEEHVPDGEVILKQGAAADTAVIITTGACKLLLKVEQSELEEAARQAGWQHDGAASAAKRGQATASRLKSTHRPVKSLRTVELAEINYGELCGESAILQEGQYDASLVATHSTSVVRLPVETLLQHMNKADVARLNEFCSMRKQFRLRQLQSKALSLLSSTSSAVSFAQEAHRKEASRAAKVESRWIPSSKPGQTRQSPSLTPLDDIESRAVSSYKTPQQIRREAEHDVMEAYKSANLKEQFRDILDRATSGMSITDERHDALTVPRSRSSEPGLVMGAAPGSKMSTWPIQKPDTEVAPRSKSVSAGYHLRTLAVDEDTVGSMLDEQCGHVGVTLPKPRHHPMPAVKPPLQLEAPGQLPLFPPDYPSLDAIISRTAGKAQTRGGTHSGEAARPRAKAADPRLVRSQREVLPPAVGLRSGSRVDYRREPQPAEPGSNAGRGAQGGAHRSPSTQRQAGGQRAGHLRHAGRLENPLAVGPRKLQAPSHYAFDLGD